MFGFENWPVFDQELLNEIYDDDSEEREFNHKIYGFDLNLPAVNAALANVRSAHVQDCVEVAQRDIRDFQAPLQLPPSGGEPDGTEGVADASQSLPLTGGAGGGLLVTNPPYGERLRPEDLTVIYKTLGEVLKKKFTGGEAWVISSKEELFDAMRLRPSFKVPLQNGSIDCELRKYVTFSGKLEDFRGDGGIVKTDDEKQRMGEKKRFRDGRERTFSRKFRPTPDPSLRGRGEDAEENGGWRDRSTSPFPRREGAGDGSFRRDEDFFEDDEMAAQYRNLRSRHRSFEGARDARERKERGEERPRKGGRDFKGGDRDFKGGNRDFKGGKKPFNKGGRDHKGGDRDFRGGKKPFRGRRDE